MELEPSFKLSEAGPIPEDWEVLPIGTVERKVGSGKTPTGGAAMYRTHGRPFVRSQNVGWGLLDLEDLAYIDNNTHSTFIGSEIEINDVLLNITGASIGRSAIADSRLTGGNVNQHVCIIRTDASRFSPYLLNVLLLSPAGQKQIDDFQAGGGRQGLNFNQVRRIHFAVPPSSAEQQAIASRLADLDAWIVAAEAEATKLASVKAAAMDALLTPTTRLPGFSGKWCPVRIADLYDSLSTVAVSRAAYAHGDGVACIHYGDIHVRYDGFVRIGRDEVAAVPAGLVRSAARLLSGDVLIADAAEDLDGVGKAVELIAPANFQVVGGLHVQALRPKTGKLALGFAGYLFRQAAYRDSVERAASGLKVYGISKSQLSALEVVLPPTLEEQQAITAVLSDIDAALAAARAVVAKARNVKAAAMDSLLSGHVRLPGFGPAARRASADALEAA